MNSASMERVGERIRRPERLVGKVVVGEYPSHNFEGVPFEYEVRRVLVERVRTLAREPLDPTTELRNPLQLRTGVLITGVDLDKQAERSFYLGRFRSWCAIRRADLPATRSAVVFLVDRPHDWRPATQDELPPGVERRDRLTPERAAIYARHFNGLELVEPSGRWAVL